MKLSKRNVGLIIGLCFFICSCRNTSPDINNSADDTINILYLAWQNDGHLWASDYSQLIRWNTQTKQKEIFKDYGGELYVDSDNVLWVFDNGIIRRFDGKEWDYYGTYKGACYVCFIEMKKPQPIKEEV